MHGRSDSGSDVEMQSRYDEAVTTCPYGLTETCHRYSEAGATHIDVNAFACERRGHSENGCADGEVVENEKHLEERSPRSLVALVCVEVKTCLFAFVGGLGRHRHAFCDYCP